MEQARKVAMSFFCETIRSRGGIPRLQLVWDGESTTTRGGIYLPHFMCLTVWIVMGL